MSTIRASWLSGKFSADSVPLVSSNASLWKSIKPKTESIIIRHTWLYSGLWKWEYLAMTGAIASLVVVIITLGMYDNKLLSSWPHDVQINTVLSAMATLLKGCMLVTVCACLSQLKWTWYAKSGQPLHDFQIFDGASRGPLRAAQLLYRLNLGHTASLGSLVVLLALASDAFIQQSVSYPLRQSSQKSAHAAVPFAQVYSQYATVLDGSAIISPSLLTAIYDGMFSANLSQSASSVIPECSTGNCTFPKFTSLAVCSHCVNVSSLLQYSYDANIDPDGSTLGVIYNYTLPNGVTLSSGESAVALITMASADFTGLNSDALFPYLGLGQISNTSFITGPHNAWDCVLSFCAKTYNTSVSRTVFSETPSVILDEPVWTGNTTMLQTYYSFEVPATLLNDGFNQSHTFAVDNIAQETLTNQIAATIQGVGEIADNGVPYFSTDVAQAFYYANVTDINRTMANVADALTNAIRVISQDHVPGTTYALETFIHVEWPWLLFPALMLLLALFFFGLTLHHSYRTDVPTWRSNALAVMDFGVSRVIVQDEPGTDFSRLMQSSADGETLSHLEDWAKHTIVRLRTKGLDGKRYGLVVS